MITHRCTPYVHKTATSYMPSFIRALVCLALCLRKAGSVQHGEPTKGGCGCGFGFGCGCGCGGGFVCVCACVCVCVCVCGGGGGVLCVCVFVVVVVCVSSSENQHVFPCMSHPQPSHYPPNSHPCSQLGHSSSHHNMVIHHHTCV